MPHTTDDCRVAELIEKLGLQPHPEGGHYRRAHVAALAVADPASGAPRPAASAIHYLLRVGETSRWHRIDAEEVWHHAEGAPLELCLFDADTGALHRRRLGRFDSATATTPLVAVPAGCWQAARPLGAWSLVGCSVAPAFEFRGFTLLDAAPGVREAIARLAPELLALA